MTMPNEFVKCSECGYLSLRNEQQFIEVGEDLRNEWQSGDHPKCFVRQPQLREEIEREALVDDRIRGATATEVIQRPRICERFRKWDQGSSPKEHVKMHMFEKQEARDREWREAQMRFEADQSQIQREWRKQDQRATRVNTLIAFASVVVAVLVPSCSLIFDWLKPEKQITIKVVTESPATRIEIPQ